MKALSGLTLIALLASLATAQVQPGDIIAASSNQQVLYRIDSAGTLTTFANLPVRAQSLALGVANRGFIVGGGSLPDAIVEVANDGTVTTLVGTGPLTIDFDVDGEGNYLGAGFPPGASRTNAVFSVSPAGAIATVIQGGGLSGKMYAMGVNTQTGDAIVVEGLLAIRVTRGTAPTATTFANITTSGIAGIHARFDRPGTLLGAWGTAILSVDPNGSPAITTLLSGSPLVRPADIEYEPATGQYLVVDIGTNQSTIYRFDPSTATITSIIPTPGQRPTQIAIAGARRFTALNAPQVGQSFVMRASFPGQAGQPFVAALSFGMAPGIPVPGGTVYLSADAFFLLSLTNAGIFSGFQGTLNALGEATPTLAIPAIAGLAGFRFFGAAVAVPTSGPLQVSEPAGFTIR